MHTNQTTLAQPLHFKSVVFFCVLCLWLCVCSSSLVCDMNRGHTFTFVPKDRATPHRISLALALSLPHARIHTLFTCRAVSRCVVRVTSLLPGCLCGCTRTTDVDSRCARVCAPHKFCPILSGTASSSIHTAHIDTELQSEPG